MSTTTKSTQTKKLTKLEREIISHCLELGMSHNAIARSLSRSQPSISREIKRNSKIDLVSSLMLYDPKFAHKECESRRFAANGNLTKIVTNSGSKLETYIVARIKDKWSPEQIAGRIGFRKNLKLLKTLTKAEQKELLELESEISHESIYNWIYNLGKDKESPNYSKELTLKLDLTSNFRHRKGKYRRRHGTRKRREECEALKKKRIDTRPKIIETKTTIGHWEIDTIVGREKKQHILTQVDRRSKYLITRKLNIITAHETNKQIIESYQNIPKHKILTQTSDNGVQFNKLDVVEEKLGIQVYYAYPYHSWERGINENTNGLIRQYYKKGSAFNDITQIELDQVTNMINNRPRKTLNYLTPSQVFHNDLNFESYAIRG
jgi:transposase, IS30 family